MQPGYDKLSLARAQALRRTATRPEIALWTILRGGRLGAKFRRQQPIGPFIADFYCAASLLIVEVDGAQHPDEPEVDARRTHWLEAHGYRVIRFDNHLVLTNPEAVIRSIMDAISPPHPGALRHPSPSRGEGK